MIKIGIPSKGRLRKNTLSIFSKNKLKLTSERGERDLFGYIKGFKNVNINYLHAREIIERLGDGSLDFGFSGYDLLKESELNIQKKITLKKFIIILISSLAVLGILQFENYKTYYYNQSTNVQHYQTKQLIALD